MKRIFIMIAIVLTLLCVSDAPAQIGNIQFNLALQKEDLAVQLKTDDPFESKQMPSSSTGCLYVLYTEFTRSVSGSFSSPREYSDGSSSLKLLNRSGKIPAETSGSLNSASCRVFCCESGEKALAYYQFLSKDSITNEVNNCRKAGDEAEILQTDIYGEKSASCLISEKLDSFWPLSITLINPGKRVKLKSIFKVKNVVGWFEMSWIEGIPQQAPVKAVASMMDKNGREERPTVEGEAKFAEPLSTKGAGDTALRKWIERLNRELNGPDALAIEIGSDRSEYESGDRVVFSGAIKKRQNGAFVNYGKEAPFTLLCSIDGGAPFIMSRNGPLKTRKDGTFSFTPFAPSRTGTYSIKACVIPADYPEMMSSKKTLTELSAVSFAVKAPPREPQESLRARGERIIAVYNAKIPSHRDEVIRKFNSLNIIKKEEAGAPAVNESFALIQNLSTSLERPGTYLQILLFGTPKLDDMLFGAYNNQYFNDNSFTCFNYGVRTLQLLNSLRFSDDRSERDLMRGIDYGPVMRGISRESDSLLDIITGNECGEHHAVVLYGFHDDWRNENTTVLDPWPTQSPAIYTLGEFRRFYGTEYFERGRWKVAPDPQWDSSYEIKTFPIHDSPVYWNFNWEGYQGWGNTDYTGYSGLKPAKKPSLYLVGASPVALDVTDSKGRHVGLSDEGGLTAEIEGTELFVHPKSRNDLAWYFKLPEGEYNVSIRGIADGEAHITTGMGNGRIASYTPSLKSGEKATLTLKADAAPLPMTLPDGRKVQPVLYSAPKTFPYALLVAASAILIIPVLIALVLLARWRLSRHSGVLPADSENGGICINCGAPYSDGDLFCSRCSSPLADSSASRPAGGREAHSRSYVTGLIVGFVAVILMSAAIFAVLKATILKEPSRGRSLPGPSTGLKISPDQPSPAAPQASPPAQTSPAVPPVQATPAASPAPVLPDLSPAPAPAKEPHPSLKAVMQFVAYTNAKEWDRAYDMTSREGMKKASLSDFNNNWRNNCGMNVEKCELIESDGEKARVYLLVTSWDTNERTGDVDRYQYGGVVTLVLEDNAWKLTDPLMKTVKKIK